MRSRSAGWCARRYQRAAHNPPDGLNGGLLGPLRGVVRSFYQRRQFHSLAEYRPHPQTSSVFDPRRLLHRLEDVGAGWRPIVGGEDSGDRGAALRHPDRSRSAVRPRPPTRDWSRPRWAPHCVRVPIARQLNPTLERRVMDRRGWLAGAARTGALWRSWGREDVSSACGLARAPFGSLREASKVCADFTPQV